MSRQTLALAAFVAASALCQPWIPRSGAAEPREARDPGFSCFPLVRRALSVAIPEDLAVTEAMARAFHGFRRGFLASEEVRRLDPRRQSICHRDAERAARQVLGIVKARFLSLILRERDAERFYLELLVFLKPWEEKERDALVLDPLFDEVHVEYARLLHESLLGEVRALRLDRWRPYVEAAVDFEGWSEDWSRGLGRAEPAAVDMENRRIAVRSHAHDPGTMRVLLFHEFAHLRDPGLPELLADNSERTSPSAVPTSLERRFQNELFAWNRTIEFVREREQAGVPVPGYFRNQVFPMMRLFGLEEWVRGILRSRGL